MKNVIKILSFLMVLIIMSCVFSVAVCAQDGEEYKYKDKVFELFGITEEEVLTNELYGKTIYYHEGYRYYSDNSQSTPDFVCISIREPFVSDIGATIVFDEYVIDRNVSYSPMNLGYAIYFPETNTACSLEKAFNDNVEGIYNVFTEGGVGRLIGDTDMDRKLTIKDATVIQKCVAQIIEWDRDDDLYAYDLAIKYISDFNRDGERNVKDATAIQKHIAGLPY